MDNNEDFLTKVRQTANARKIGKPLDSAPVLEPVEPPDAGLSSLATPQPVVKPLSAMDVRKDQLGLAINKASTANPVEAAQRREVAKTLGVAPSLISNVQEAKAEAFVKKQSNMDRLINENPELARFMLANDHNPELVGQEVEPLAKLAKLGRRLGIDPLISLVGKGSSMVTQGVVGLADLGGALIPGKDIGQHLQEAGFDFKALDQLLEESYSPEQQLANQNVAKAEGFVGTMGAIAENPSAAAHWVLSSLSLLAGGGAISQTLLKVAPHVGARIAAGVGEGALVAGTLQEQIRQKTATGTTTPTQKALAVVGGVGTGIIGGIGASIAKKAGIPDIDSYIAQGGLKGALEAAKTPSSLIKAVVGGVVIEGAAEEMPQSVWEKFIENVATGMPWDHELGKEAAIGLVAGSMTQAGFTPMMVRGANQQIADNVDKDKKKAAFEVLKKTSEGFKAEERRKQFEELGKAAAETPLRNTSAESFGEFVDQMTEDSDITDVFVDEKKLTEIFAQSGLTEKEIAEKMPALAAELKIARGAKTDVKIPMKDYLTHIAGAPAEKALLDHLKIDPEGMSFAESQAFFQGQKADLDLKAQEIVAQNTPVLTAEEYAVEPEAGKTYEQYLAEHTNTREVIKADSDIVYQKLLGGLEKAGRFSPAANAVYAIPFREFFVTAAARESKASGRLVLPSEVYAREPLNFARQNLAGFTQTPAEGVPAVATTEDFSPENVSNILDKEGWVLMTAANPENTTQSAEQNDAANKALIADLESRGLKHEVVQGRYGNDETETPSVLILGTDRATQLELVRKYRQESILTKEGLIFQDGSILPPQGGVTTFKDTKKAFASGGYTRIPSTGTIFSLSFEGSVPRQPGSAFYRAGLPQPGSMTLVGVHYSKEARTVLEGKRFGEGYPGAERERLLYGAKEGDPIRTRVDFYTDTGNGVKPESGLGGVRHEILLTNVYDASTNPQKFSAPATWDGMNTFEQQVLVAGYDGYYIEQSGQGRVVVLGQAAEQIPVPTKEQLDEQRRERILQSETGAEPPAREADGSLKGLPRQVGGFNAAHYARAEEVTRDYMAAAGLPYNPPTTYATVDPVRATRIADAFEAMKHDPQNSEVKAAYDALIKETTAQYQAVIDSGLVVEFIDFEKTGDPYAGNPRAMTEDVINNNHMWVFSTREGFGSSEFDPADNPLLNETEFTISGQKALANDLFRVVHDYFGHVKEGVGFRATGEENAWRAHMSMFSPLAGRALTVETRGQNSWVNYGPYAESNRTASAGDTHYADQKIGLLPEWVSTEGATDTTAIDHYFQFAGEASLSADVNSLETAKRMLAQGTHQESVRRSTGWFKGADGRWRYEINDYDATLLNDDYPSKNFGDFWTGIEKEKIDSGMLSADDIKDGAGVKLSDVLDHPALFTAYPGLRDIIVKPQLERGGSYNRGTNVIAIGYDIKDGARSNPATIFSILMHEVQHAIQTLEGFARGGNLAIAEYVSSEQLTKALDENRAKSDAVGLEDPYGLENRMASGYAVPHEEKQKLLKWNDLQAERSRILEKKMKPMDAYLRLYGEMEARNVQSRLNLDEFGRRVTPIQETYNEGLTDEDAVVILNDELIKLPPLSAMIVSTRTPTPQAGREDPHLSSGLNVDIEALYRAPSMINAIVNGTPTIKGITSYKGFKLPRSKDPKKVIESFIQQMTGNLLWLHDQVPAEVRERSKQWYDGGRVLVDRMVDRHKGLYTPQQAAAAYALMSPNMPWDRNVSLSDRLVDTWTYQQDTPWSPEMDKTLTRMAATTPAVEGVRGKLLSELETDTDRAYWIRAYDEAHNPEGFRELTPEGGYGDYVRNKDGSPTQASWFTYGPMSKAIAVLRDGSMPNISRNLGAKHKVRNFYNNLIQPSDSISITADTHAVAAAHLRPLGGSATEVTNSLGKLGSSPAEGLSGTYVMYAEAYRRAAEQRGLKPREMQSITWEAGRGLFNPSFKTNYAKSKELRNNFDAISTDLNKGVIDHAEARKRILELSGGIQDPSWTRWDSRLHADSPGSSYTEELLGAERAQGALDSRRRSATPGGAPGLGRFPGYGQGGILPDTLTIDGVERPTKNSEGRPIRPTEEGVRNFWKWFGGSKVVDKQGRPMVVYRGDSPGKTEFTGKGKGIRLPGNIFFTDSRYVADRYARRGELYSVYLRIIDPHTVDAEGAEWSEIPAPGEVKDEWGNPDKTIQIDELAKWAQGKGRDGLVVHDVLDQYGDGTQYAVFDPEQIEFATSPELLAQGPRASFDPTNLTIALLKGADLSSVIHEGGHFYLEALSRMAAMPEAPQSVRDDFQKTMDWFGVTADVWTVMDMEARRPYHEQWAQSWERYALEGKSPTVEMQPVFAKFRAWMLNVYKSMKEFLKQNPLAGRLNDDVRAVFDRLIASEDKIAEAEKIRGYMPLFTSADQAGLTQEKFQEYLDMGQAATDAATSTLAARSIKDMQWAAGARSTAIKKLQNEARAKRKEILAETTQEVMEEPVNQARLFLTKGETLQDDGTKVKAEAGFKLDKAALQELYPGIDLSSISRMVGADGIAPDLAAQMFAFPSGQALVDALLNEESARDKITGLTDQRMLERYGDLTDEKAIERAADAAIHNRVRAKFMATGLALLRKQPGAAAAINKAARMAAEGALAGKMIRDLKPNQFTAAESRANAEAIKRAATNPQGAVEAQRAALLNNHMARIARNTLDEVEAGLRYVKKFDKQALRKTLGPAYLEQIDDLLSNFDFRKSTPLSKIDKAHSLQDWLDEQEANGYEPALDTDLLELLKRKSYKEMTAEEFIGLLDAIKQIEHIARLKNKLLTAKEAKEFKATIDEAEASIVDNANRTVPERETPTDIVGKMGKWFRQMVASHRKFNSIVREMDGFKNAGVMWDILARPMNEAGDKEVEMRQQAAEALGDLFGELKNKDTVPANLYAKKRIVPGTDISMTQEQRIMFGMNWGNEGNRQRLMDGGITGRKALSIEEAEAILDTLTKEEWDFIQGTLDFVGSYREQIAALERQLTGTEPKWIDPAPIETKFGSYKGGYFPAKYDAEMSTRSESLDAVNDMRMGMKGAFGSSATRNGYTKERAKQVIGRPLLLSFNTISQHVSEVTHRLAWQPWLIDANRILKALDAPIREHYGTEILREMRNTVLDIAAGDIGARNAMEAAINHLRTGSTIVGMGWKVTTALLQPSGLAQSWTRLGSRWASVGVARYLRNPLAAGAFVDERSSLMRNRGITMQREINEVLNTLRSGDKISAVTGSYFTMIGKMQRTVDIPTWIGAYNRDLAEAGYENALGEEERAKMEEHAVAVADQTVIDTQSGGQIKDLASIQRGSPLQKLFTNFYSYFSATYNLNVEAVRRTSFKSPGEVGLLAIDLILLNVVPVLFGVALKQIMKGDCDLDDTECLLKKVAQEQISYMAGQMIILREVAVAAQAVTGGDTYGYQGPAGLRFFSDLYKLGTQTEQGDADLGWFKAANSVGGALLHYPAGQINATMDGIMAIEDGRVEGLSILPALIAGAPKE